MVRYISTFYTLTIFLSALLLFVFQPMVGKYLLPQLGGSPSVWNTAMLFFQLLLLVGYIYAHLLSRIKNFRYQVCIHLVLIILAGLALPLSLPNSDSNPTQSPIFWQIRTMIEMAAAPFFILSASAPLLQKWFSHTSHSSASNPYFMYAASNTGSMLALLSYPFIIEPLIGLHEQSFVWMIGYFILFGLYILCGFTPKFQESPRESAIDENIKLVTKIKWIFLAFCPSSLMMGYTTYITTDIASTPLFWVLPLSLYLATFIIAFSSKNIIPLSITRFVQAALFLLVLSTTLITSNYSVWEMASLHGLFFFITALLCHQELFALRPSPQKLTEFYLFLSIGGAIGGIFNVLIAPVIFNLAYEYYIVIFLCLFARYLSIPIDISLFFKKIKEASLKNVAKSPYFVLLIAASTYYLNENALAFSALLFFAFIILLKITSERAAFAGLAITMSILTAPIIMSSSGKLLLVKRNYFGILKVVNENNTNIMYHGTTYHGAQSTIPGQERILSAYYHPNGASGDVFSAIHKHEESKKIAVMGLGVGMTACHDNINSSIDYYEIDKDVVDLAENEKYFSFLKKCGTPYKIFLGDARQEIKKAKDKSYDLIQLDVFSSDNIPIHLLTRDALKIYSQKLKDDGIISVHISNRYFDLKPEVSLLAKNLGYKALFKSDPDGIAPGTTLKYFAATFTALTNNKETIAFLKSKGWAEIPAYDARPWTDDYANILRALKKN